jgi:PTH1 family peptidyl-tRNA hydrolase
VSKDKFSGLYGTGKLGSTPVVLLKPQTFMNRSGQSVVPALQFFKVKPASLIVIHDELDVPFSDCRLKVGGGHAGHNGLRSIIGQLGSRDFIRL